MRLVALAMAAAIHRHHAKSRFGQRAVPAGGFPVLFAAGAEAMHQQHGIASHPFKGQPHAVGGSGKFCHDRFLSGHIRKAACLSMMPP